MDDTQRDWLSFEHDGDTYLFDLSFLLSPWRCIFGEGCKGVMETDATELGHGCCSFGAHFADAGDRKRVRAAAQHLTAAQWQNRSAAKKLGGPIGRNEDGEWTTKLHNGACIFLNHPDFDRGAGCALHLAALESGERPMDLKPEVCWQLPLRFENHTDEVGHTTYTLREWKRRDWGEGGLEFHWWCTESPEAFIDPEAVIDTLRDEIVGLVGQPVYAQLQERIGQRPVTSWVPHPAVRRK